MRTPHEQAFLESWGGGVSARGWRGRRRAAGGRFAAHPGGGGGAGAATAAGRVRRGRVTTALFLGGDGGLHGRAGRGALDRAVAHGHRIGGRAGRTTLDDQGIEVSAEGLEREHELRRGDGLGGGEDPSVGAAVDGPLLAHGRAEASCLRRDVAADGERHPERARGGAECEPDDHVTPELQVGAGARHVGRA